MVVYLRVHIVDLLTLDARARDFTTQVVSTRFNAVLDLCGVASSMIVKNLEMIFSQKC